MKRHKHYLFFFALLLSLPIQAQRVKTDRSTGNKGFVDKDGKVLIPFLYAELPQYLDSVMIAKKGAYRGLIDNKGNILLPFQYLELRMPVDHTGQKSGLVLVKNTAGQWGIADLSGNLILQPQYEVVAAIDKTLLASRKKADRELQFYDGTGKPLFTLEGDRADRGFDANSMLVIGWDYKARYLTRNGKAIFPDNVHDIKWTDGSLIVSGGYNSQGLTNAKGDTLLPFEYWAIRPGLSEQFWVQNKNYEQAILDITGKVIVPFDRWEIRTYDNYYRACKKTMRECGFYSASGKVILPAEYNISAYKSVEPYDGDPAAEPDFLFRVGREKAPYRSGLYLAKDATQILPIEYQYIYFKDGDFPILAIRENEDQISEAMAFDLSGNPLLEKYTRSLRYTSNPGCLLSANEKGRWAFLNLNNRGSDADYRYSSPIQIRDDYYYCWVNDTVALMQLCGKQLYAGMLTKVIPANDYYTKLFQKTPNTKGRLLLVGKKPEMGPHECIGLNEEGEEFYLSDADLEVSTICTPAPLEHQVFEVVKEPAQEESVQTDQATVQPEELVIEVPAPPENKEPTIWLNNMLAYKAYYPGSLDTIAGYQVKSLKPITGQSCSLVYVEFVVETDGSLSNINLKSPEVPKECGEAALSFVRSMDPWRPAEHAEKPVRSRVTLPVIFKD